MPLGPGETFERYAIEASIGRGGMGEVYRAVDTRLRRKVALKVIRPDKDRPDAAARLYREARAAAALTHPNAVAVHDVGEAEGVFYIVMELVVGQPLLAFVGDPRTGVGRKIAWVTDVARAIGAAHRAGIIHRDVKPSNVMVSDEGFAKVLDFGLARPLGPIDPVSFRTQEGRVLGTLRYMAPEQVVGAEPDTRSDQYAFGLTAYELLAGTHPGGALIDTKPKRIDELAPEVPPDVALVIERTLARDPDKRFASMDEVVNALEASISTQRAPPPYMTPSPMVAAPAPSAETAETLSGAKVEIAMRPSNRPPHSDDLGRPPTLAALAEAGAKDSSSMKSGDATLISKEAPSALVHERNAAALTAKTLPLGAAAPVAIAAPPPNAARAPTSNPPPGSPAAVSPMLAPGSPALAPARIPAPVIPSAPPPRAPAATSASPSSQKTTIIVSVAVLAIAAFTGTYLGAQRSSAPPTSTAVTVTSSSPGAPKAIATTTGSVTFLETPSAVPPSAASASASVAPRPTTTTTAPTPGPTGAPAATPKPRGATTMNTR